MAERDGKGREGLYGQSARLKFLHMNGWKLKNRAKEERARGKNRGGEKREISSLSYRIDGCLAADDRQI